LNSDHLEYWMLFPRVFRVGWLGVGATHWASAQSIERPSNRWRLTARTMQPAHTSRTLNWYVLSSRVILLQWHVMSTNFEYWCKFYQKVLYSQGNELYNIPSKSMRTPVYCYEFTCVSLSSSMLLGLPSRALLVHVGTFASDVDPNLVRFEHSEVTRWGIGGPTWPKY
jgi:hypothetical protein